MPLLLALASGLFLRQPGQLPMFWALCAPLEREQMAPLLAFPLFLSSSSLSLVAVSLFFSFLFGKRIPLAHCQYKTRGWGRSFRGLASTYLRMSHGRSAVSVFRVRVHVFCALVVVFSCGMLVSGCREEPRADVPEEWTNAARSRAMKMHVIEENGK